MVKRLSMLVETAKLYYEHQLTQQQIAKKLDISRPTVSRLLQQARLEGIVEIKIFDPSEKGTRLERELSEKYSLKSSIVVPNDGENSAIIKKRLGKAAVILLDKILQENTILGISWGSTMQEVARNVRKKEMNEMVVVQLNGGISRAEYDTHASEIAQKIGENYKAIPYLLPLPAIVDSAELKQAIVSDKNISRTLELGRRSEIALFTIGSFGFDSVLVKADYFESEEVDNLLSRGAVGDICSRIIDHNGEICSSELNSRTIGIELEDLKGKAYSIAVAGDKEKFAAVQAGLKGQWFNSLITDEWVATELMKE